MTQEPAPLHCIRRSWICWLAQEIHRPLKHGLLALIVLCVGMVSVEAFGAEPPPCDQADGSVEAVTLADPPGAEYTAVPNRPLGANTVYSREDDAFWEKLDAKETLAALGLGALRFPGGEAADNYNWETGRLERPQAWPFEAASEDELNGRTDFREFLAHARRWGINNLFFVVNVDGAFRGAAYSEERLLQYADSAARWVNAVKMAGFHVPYWEIGNEPYLKSGYPLTAAEYGHALQVFYSAMKKSDSSIMVGAAGPGPKGTGFADRLTAPQLQYFRKELDGGNEICKTLAADLCIQKLREVVPGFAGVPGGWWDSVTAQASGKFDFAAVHRYGDPVIPKNPRAEFRETKLLRQLRNVLESFTGHSVGLAVTEWNVKRKVRSDSFLRYSVMLGNLLNSGADSLLYHPLSGPVNAQRKPLIVSDGELTGEGRLMSLVTSMIGGAKVAQSAIGSEIYVLFIRGQNEIAAMIVTSGSRPLTVIMPPSFNVGTSMSVTRFGSDKNGVVTQASTCLVELGPGPPSDRFLVTSLPSTVTVVKAPFDSRR